MADVQFGSKYFEWLAEFLTRQAVTKKSGSYREFLELKGIDSSGQPVFREMVGASPISILLESFLLDIIRTRQVYQPPPCVYSYRWPATDGRNQIFSYFLKDYFRRDRDVQEALSKTADAVAIVVDIEGFYPNAKKDVCEKRLRELFKKAELPDLENRIANQLSEIVLNGLPNNSIPIGPAIGHFLGQLALMKVDSICMEQFPGGYFRYVDDIVVVVSKSKVKETLSWLESVLDREEFSLNTNKTDIVPSENWRSQDNYHAMTDGSDLFQGIVDVLKIFLSLHPEKYVEVRKRLVDDGCCLPLNSLRAVSATSWYRRNLLWVWQHARGNKQFGKLSVEGLVNQASRARVHYRDVCRRLINIEAPITGMARRWHVQSARYAFNRLLYFSGLNMEGTELESLPEIAELFQLRTVVRAIKARDCTALLDLPSVATKTFAGIASEYMAGDVKVDWESKQDTWLKDGVAPLLLHNVVQMPATLRNKLSLNDREFLNFCETRDVDKRNMRDHSAVDELRCLQLGEGRASILSFLSSRFDDEEDVALDGLFLDAGGYLS